jgi:hypothetical protein
MAIIHHHNGSATKPEAASNDASYCPGCGTVVAGVRYCPECGHAIPLPALTQPQPTVEQPTVEQPGPTVEEPEVMRAPVSDGVAPARERRRVRIVALSAAGALVLVVAAAAAIVLLNNGSKSQPSSSSSYRPQLSSALAPVIAANRTLSSTLQSLDGSQPTIRATTNATTQAKSAVDGAHGAVAVLTVPNSDQTLSQQVQQALAQEAGYVQAVSATLAAPTGQSASQLQTLATGTQSALVPLAAVAAGAASSVSGAENLMSWATGAAGQAKSQSDAAQRKALQQAAQSASHTTVIVPPASGSAPPAATSSGSGYVTPSGNQVPGSWSTSAATYASGTGTPYSWSGGQQCDRNIFAGGSTSCGFATNIFEVVAAANHYDSVIPASLTADNPATGATDSVTCTEYWGKDNQTDVQCITADGTGTAFPLWAATSYYP